MTARFIAYPDGEDFDDWSDGTADGPDAESAAKALMFDMHRAEGADRIIAIVRAPDGTETRWVATFVVRATEYSARRTT